MATRRRPVESTTPGIYTVAMPLLNADEIAAAVDLQRRSYNLLRWMADAAELILQSEGALLARMAALVEQP